MDEAERLYHESLSLFKSGQFQSAIAALEQSLTLNPGFLDALEALGVLYARFDRLDDAIRSMEQLKKLAPNHIMARTNLSRFYAQKGMILEAEQEQAEARRLIWKAELQSQKKESMASAKSPEEEASDRKREAEDRIKRYQKVIELDSSDVLGYFSLGTAYLDSGDLIAAEKAFEQAVLVDENHSPSYFQLGVTLESLKKCARAIEVYEKGIQVADRRGDMIPFKKMSARLNALKSKL